ncbi:aminotransferase class I/II-fold pyridoxal phosphate-dependent enzyme [Paenibacillus sp. SYP-B3998]|uniref:Aminotransferase class I/II-fold pyridoxal phosphate-dependent enzyme n=1 Tax=Paenibacillus sp. SYP-B3998 TaxID=2678564 RepID=A0A6G4A739_9BACL|nr:aminotransferase class I/II-fold pyridoxal phosphate-dependent enzyme [Paenibacillus sp. SYP-B3998]NEW09619.1 aminotransferase class I/II-fold pyridoxal phosphate-dependent enzyme [Paenibacillus sp. SYP-B3998]
MYPHNSNRFKTPLFEAMLAHHHSNSTSFHVPGHKSGRGVMEEAREFFYPVMSMDFTEITGLDDLHHAEGAILEAEQLAADCFGAEETYFLVGGSTVGNLAMITTVCEPNDLILVQRNVHKSVIHGLMLAGARAIFLTPAWDSETGVATGINIEDVKQALAKYPEAKALFLTNPNYYGMGIELKPFAELMHKHGKMLLVDEAHGAHFGFHEEVPISALSCGADAVVQSTHKMLTAMTMGAMLHVQGPRIDRETIKQRLAMLQSSSPSYPILASLDLARKRMHTEGSTWLEQGLEVVKEFRGLLNKLEVLGYFMKDSPIAKGHGNVTVDPFKVSIYDRTGRLSGSELREQLEAQGCFVEMADPRQVLLVFTPASSRDDAQRVYQALCNICLGLGGQKKELQAPISNISILLQDAPISTPIVFGLRELRKTGAEESNVRTATVQEAIGKRSADMVIPYPPGIPYLYPGEIISMSMAEALQQLADNGIRFQGTAFGQTQKLKIYT